MYTTSYTDITKEKGEMISKSFATLNSYGLDNKKMYVANISLDCILLRWNLPTISIFWGSEHLNQT